MIHHLILSVLFFTVNASEQSQSHYTPQQTSFWICLLTSFCIILLAGVCSGMTVGYLSIDEMTLEMKLINGTSAEKKSATVILNMLKKHHLLLCTLLVANAICMESLPIFFDKIVPAALAIFFSVFFLVFAGEILPQAICTGPKQLIIAEKLSPIINIIMYSLFFINYPLSKLLDVLFGGHEIFRFKKEELKTLIELHQVAKNENHSKDGLNQDECMIINSTIDLRKKTVKMCMIPIEKSLVLNNKQPLNDTILEKISASGYSNIPVYENKKNNIIGVIKAKKLAQTLEIGQNLISKQNLINNETVIVSEDTSMLEMLLIFKNKRTKIAFITNQIREKKREYQSEYKSLVIPKDNYQNDQNHQIIGLICLKDIFEEIVRKKFENKDEENLENLKSFNQELVSKKKGKSHREAIEEKEH